LNGKSSNTAIKIRQAEPSDHDWIVAKVDAWWGRPVASALPRLFLDHFHTTSLVAEAASQPIGFLIGFHSPSNQSEAYIHFVGVDPAQRHRAIGRSLYERFFSAARADGRTSVSAITASVNEVSIEFHRAMGFSVSQPIAGYDSPGTSHVLFRRIL
jgi:ribosomal protein S18 acetylase RimI-like enzyme